MENRKLELEEAKNIKGIQKISIVHGVGEEITEVTSSGARMGFIIAQDVDVNYAIDDCQNALKLINIEIE